MLRVGIASHTPPQILKNVRYGVQSGVPVVPRDVRIFFEAVV
jgi:hypothetical protein